MFLPSACQLLTLYLTAFCLVQAAQIAPHSSPALTTQNRENLHYPDDIQCDGQCDGFKKGNNGSCLINQSHNYVTSVSWSYTGDIRFCNGAKISVKWGDLVITATGSITVDEISALEVQDGNLQLSAGQVIMSNQSSLTLKSRLDSHSIKVTSSEQEVHIGGGASVDGDFDVAILGSGAHLDNGASVTAGRNLLLGGSDDCEANDKDVCQNKVVVAYSTVQAKSVNLCCRGSEIDIRDTTDISTPYPSSSVMIHGQRIRFDPSSSIETVSLSVHATGDANISGSLPGIQVMDAHPRLGRRGAPSQIYCSVNLSVVGQLTLGQNGGTDDGPWNVQLLRAIAGSITLPAGQKIFTNISRSSCDNKQTLLHDRCTEILKGIPVDPDDPGGQHKNSNVSFDFLLAAHKDLSIHAATHIKAASMMICSGVKATVMDGVALDVRGRGCGPGTGSGPGESRVPYVGCGAGGGSHIGKGGLGAMYQTKGVQPCAAGGRQNDELVPGLVPSQGASGGGCGVPPPCTKERYAVLHSPDSPSAGGGLIWVSTTEIVSHGKITITADGVGGKEVPYSESSQRSLLSGGGSGGQVIIFASKFTQYPGTSIKVSAVGGPTACIAPPDPDRPGMVSGAGGGGFVGLMWEGGKMDAVASDVIQVNVAGGGISAECKASLPKVSVQELTGKPGLASSLLPCSAGLWGLFCVPCEVGKYKSNDTETCSPCKTKPDRNAEYIGEGGWTNSSCPYHCTAGVPNVISNPTCLDALEYALHFYGGVAGLCCLLAVLILATAILLCRRTTLAKRFFSHANIASQSFVAEPSGHSGLIRRIVRRLSRCCGCSRRREGRPQSSSMLQFTREQLPFHVGRVYLCGQNTLSRPWVLGDKVPDLIEELVVTQMWENFAFEATSLAKVPVKEGYYEQLLRALYPAMLSHFKCWRRHQRAQKLRRCAHNHSEGSGEFSAVWRPIRVGGMSRLVMAFGCDAGATLGYLDFFDFSRSQYDWAPVDLRREVRLLVAHGLGSYAEPFQLDTGDPIVHHLAQNCFGSLAVFSIISTFNRISRLMSAVELDFYDTGGRVFASLREKVEQCALKCGLAGCVQVLLLPQLAVTNQDTPISHSLAAPRDTNTSFSDLIRTRSPESMHGGLPGDLPLLAPPTNHSLEGLQPFSRVIEQGATTVTSQSVSSSQRRKPCMRLCLAFIDSATIETRSACGANGDQPHPLGVPFTSPMQHTSLAEHLAWLPQREPEVKNHPASMQAVTSWLAHCRWQLTACLLSVRLKAWTGRVAAVRAAPPTVLLLFVIFYFADLMVFLLMGSIFLQLGSGVTALWLLVPPLTQPLAIITGPIFAFSERPRLGRLFASLTALSAVNAVFGTIAVIGIYRESWIFNFLELIIAFVVKAVLFVCTNVHIGNLEAAHDLSFMDAPQADFLGNILTCTDGPLPSPGHSVVSDRGLMPLRIQTGRSFQQQEWQDAVSPAPMRAVSMDAGSITAQAGNSSPTSTLKAHSPAPF